jgi:putative aminopeptidase FrvX
MNDYIVSIFEKLTAIPSPSGFTARAADFTLNALREMGYSAFLTKKGCVAADLGGEGNPIVLAAHIDTLGAMVSDIKGDGRLKLTPIGGLQPNNIETENCTIYTRNGKEYSGCMQLINASTHVNKEYAKAERSYDSMEVLLDENVSNKKETQDLGISVGDFVYFNPRTTVTPSGYIKSRYIDDKMSVAILLGFAKYLAENKLVPTRKTYLYITAYEEVGHGCASLPFEVDEILSVDMGCVGIGLSCTEKQVSICVKDSYGPYNYEVTTKLINIAKEKNLNYAVDIYPYYGSDADAALSAGRDAKHALIGPGVYASHGYERTHIEGVKNTFELVKAYILEAKSY